MPKSRTKPSPSHQRLAPIAVDPSVIDTFVRRELRAMSPAARDGIAALRRVLPELRLRDLDPYLAEFRREASE